MTKLHSLQTYIPYLKPRSLKYVQNCQETPLFIYILETQQQRKRKLPNYTNVHHVGIYTAFPQGQNFSKSFLSAVFLFIGIRLGKFLYYLTLTNAGSVTQIILFQKHQISKSVLNVKLKLILTKVMYIYYKQTKKNIFFVYL